MTHVSQQSASCLSCFPNGGLVASVYLQDKQLDMTANIIIAIIAIIATIAIMEDLLLACIFRILNIIAVSSI